MTLIDQLHDYQAQYFVANGKYETLPLYSRDPAAWVNRGLDRPLGPYDDIECFEYATPTRTGRQFGYEVRTEMDRGAGSVKRRRINRGPENRRDTNGQHMQDEFE